MNEIRIIEDISESFLMKLSCGIRQISNKMRRKSHQYPVQGFNLKTPEVRQVKEGGQRIRLCLENVSYSDCPFRE